jgi:PPOX class probable F420-dependent enzyme
VSDDASWAFLAEPRIGVLSVDRPERAPHASPIWYWVADGAIEFTIPGGSVKGRLLRTARGAALTVHSDAWPYRYVTAQGQAVVLRDRTVDELHRVAVRYLGQMLGEAYTAQNTTSEGVVARLTVESIVDVDFR